MTLDETSDVISNFAYLMGYDSELSYNQFADMVELHNVSPQAIVLVRMLRAKKGIIRRDLRGKVIISEL